MELFQKTLLKFEASWDRWKTLEKFHLKQNWNRINYQSENAQKIRAKRIHRQENKEIAEKKLNKRSFVPKQMESKSTVTDVLNFMMK